VALALAALVLSSASASAGPANTVTLNPIRYGLLHFQVEYERVLTENFSLFVSPIAFHHPTWYPFNKIANTTAEGIGVDLGGRFIFLGEAPTGVYIGPFLSAYYGVEHRDGLTFEGFVFSPGAQAGYQIVLWDWLALGAGVGGSYGLSTTAPPAGSPPGAGLPHSGFWLNFRSNIGIAF
jgi:hypothetical protein